MYFEGKLNLPGYQRSFKVAIKELKKDIGSDHLSEVSILKTGPIFFSTKNIFLTLKYFFQH
jgi:hypothetical protein